MVGDNTENGVGVGSGVGTGVGLEVGSGVGTSVGSGTEVLGFGAWLSLPCALACGTQAQRSMLTDRSAQSVLTANRCFILPIPVCCF